MYHVRTCDGYCELNEFIDKANKENLEIISMTKTIEDYTHCYTIIYRRPVK